MFFPKKINQVKNHRLAPTSREIISENFNSKNNPGNISTAASIVNPIVVGIQYYVGKLTVIFLPGSIQL